jgi:hypothetical protein
MLHMLLALVLALSDPSPTATAATPVAPLVYRTTLVRRYDTIGTNGTLTLWFPPSGYLRGTFVADSGGLGPVTVTGGRNGAKIWLDFPALGGLHVEGSVDRGVIHGVGTRHDSSKQYIFTATPQT